MYFVVYWYVEEPSPSSIVSPVIDEISEILCTSDDLLNKYKLTVAAGRARIATSVVPSHCLPGPYWPC